MMDWYLGQAGFSEQIQLYGDTFWRQLGSTLLWAFLAVWAVLMFVAIVMTLSRCKAPTRALVLYTGPQQRALRQPAEKAAPKVA